MSLIIGSFIIAGTLLSAIVFRTLFSPLGIYSLVWGSLILLFSIHRFLRFNYVSIRPEIWFLIFLTWFVYMPGCLSVAIAPKKKNSRNNSFSLSFPGSFTYWIKLFTIIGGFGVAFKWIILIRLFGSLPCVIHNLGYVRGEMLEGSFAFSIAVDFLVFFLFPAMIFASILATRNRKHFKWIVIILALLFLNDLSLAGRGTAVHGFILAFSAYFLTKLGTYSKALRIRDLLKFAVGGDSYFLW